MILKFRESHISNLEKARKKLVLPGGGGGGGGGDGDSEAMTTPLDDDTAVNTIVSCRRSNDRILFESMLLF